MHTSKQNKASRSVMALRRILTIAVLLSLSVGFSVGCERQTYTLSDGDTKEPDDDPDTGEPDHDHDVNGPIDEDETHGPDDDMEQIEVGLLNGSWRAAVSEDDRPIGYFDIFHDKGATTAQGTFLMASGLSDMLDGTSGDLAKVELNGDELVVSFNPTTDEDELYTMELTKASADLFTGSLSAARNPETFEVTLGRRVFDDDESAE
ncbi:hypothetical protein DL240_08060 [Lujinxingia litoralis]|uniref:Uncharacterized protein n=1 Tax=Lujinxingia litoralis TaxID=2211119 RepID=A0A328C7Q2_9DELT|nr:hypothetical protein [Lujinxingia litoralis]RAL22838.1 hypothetical protein DL240_08060 [Lujinxingia litoralis]